MANNEFNDRGYSLINSHLIGGGGGGKEKLLVSLCYFYQWGKLTISPPPPTLSQIEYFPFRQVSRLTSSIRLTS